MAGSWLLELLNRVVWWILGNTRAGEGKTMDQLLGMGNDALIMHTGAPGLIKKNLGFGISLLGYRHFHAFACMEFDLPEASKRNNSLRVMAALLFASPSGRFARPSSRPSAPPACFSLLIAVISETQTLRPTRPQRIPKYI